MAGTSDRPEEIPVELVVVADDGRVAIEVRNHGHDVVLDLDVIAGCGNRIRHARSLEGDALPVDRLDPGASVMVFVDEAAMTPDGLRTLVSYYAGGRVRRTMTTIPAPPSD